MFRDIERLLDEIAARAQSDISEAEFFRAVVERAVQAVGGRSGAVWRPRRGGLHPEYTFPQDAAAAGSFPHPDPAKWKDAAEVAMVAGRDPAGSVASHRWLLQACRLDQRLLAVIGVLLPPAAHPQLEQAAGRVLHAIAELVADYQRNRERAQLRKLGELWLELAEFTKRVHRSIDLPATAFAVANEGRRLIRCDRLTVVVRRGRRWEVAAVSGMAEIEPRSTVIQRLAQLVSAVARSQSPLYYTGEPQPLPPQVEGPLHAYVDSSSARVLAVVPLPEAREGHPPDPGGAVALVIECFQGLVDADFRTRINAVCEHAALALYNAREYSSLPGLSLARHLRWFDTGSASARFRGLAGAAAALFLAVALLLIPVDWELASPGALQPQRVRDIFAPADGEVAEVAVQHGQQVPAGAVLLTLRSSPLELEYRKILGERDTTREKLLAVESARLMNRAATETAPDAATLLTGTAEELRQLLASQEEQLSILKEQREALRVHSPLPGTVLTWDTQEALQTRPVTRGQVLLRLADMSGPWEVHLKIPDRHIGPVLRTFRDQPVTSVTFVLATEPGTVYRGRLREVSDLSEPEEFGRSVVRAVVELESGQSEIPLRPGAQVDAKIHCGRRALGFVWFRDLIEFGQRLWF